MIRKPPIYSQGLMEAIETARAKRSHSEVFVLRQIVCGLVTFILVTGPIWSQLHALAKLFAH
jgi:hypothetical protein